MRQHEPFFGLGWSDALIVITTSGAIDWARHAAPMLLIPISAVAVFWVLDRLTAIIDG
jgi:hypothetical protein